MLPRLLLLFSWGSIALARLYPSTFCFDACQLLLDAVKFNTSTQTPGKLASRCSNDLGVKSLYLCNKLFCSSDETKSRLRELSRKCKKSANITIPPFSITDGYNDDDISKLYHLQASEVRWDTELVILYELAVPSENVYHLARDTLESAYFEGRIHIIYGFAMYVFWGAVVAIGLASHFVDFATKTLGQEPRWQSLPVDDVGAGEDVSPKTENFVFGKMYLQLKRNVTVPATFGYTRSQNIGWCTVPTRIQSITIATFLILNIALCSISYRVFADNLYWPEVSTQLWRYIADRTGVISTANLALIWAFGVRNNTLLWLTGWDFATYNNFHRWVARIATVEAIIHSIAYTVLIFKDGSFADGWDLYLRYYHKKWFVAGVLATIIMTAICAFSVYGLRRKFYEIFLWLHIILSILTIITMWYHVLPFDKMYINLIWPCILVWIFDRVMRGLRILSFNPKFWRTKATVSYDSTSNIVRLVVPYSTSLRKPHPGTFYHITVLNDIRVWENHPFTIGYSTPEDGSAPATPRSPSPGITPPVSRGSSLIKRQCEISRSHNSSCSELENLIERSRTPPPSSMVFIIRPYNGFTARLRDAAISGSQSVRVLMEGPYGATQPFHKYDSILFIVGGTGIAVPLSYLDSLLGEDSNVNSLRILWAVREHKFLTDVVETDLRGHIHNEKVSLNSYVTREGELDKDSTGDSRPKRLQVSSGRPDVRREVEMAARDACAGSLAVVACGPGQMADDARKAVVDVLGEGFGRIEYFEESFNW